MNKLSRLILAQEQAEQQPNVEIGAEDAENQLKPDPKSVAAPAQDELPASQEEIDWMHKMQTIFLTNQTGAMDLDQDYKKMFLRWLFLRVHC